MSYRLDLEQPLAVAVAQTMRERVDHAIAQLRDEAATDRATAVHDARKDLKKLRSLLRLIAPGVPGAARRAENTALGDVGRSLSGARDADVMVELIDDLRDRGAGRVPSTTFDALRERLCDAVQDAGGGADDAALTAAIADLEAIGDRLDTWALGELDDDVVVAGLERAYGRGRAAFAVADEDPDPEHLHDWRKRVKDAWYHQRLLRDAWTGPLSAQADALDALADQLGDDHDLAVLRERLLAADGPAADLAVDVEPLLELIDTRHDELLASQRALGRRVYAEKPKAFARRHAAYLAAARRDHPAPSAPAAGG